MLRIKIGGQEPQTYEPKPAVRAEVFYLDPANGWSMITVDTEGNQLGSSEIAFHQKDLIDFARGHYDGLPIHVFTRTGRLSRVIEPQKEVA